MGIGLEGEEGMGVEGEVGWFLSILEIILEVFIMYVYFILLSLL